MDSELQILARAIIIDPLDNLARLAYADYLMERGQPGDEDRGKFIKLQMEMADLLAYRRTLASFSKDLLDTTERIDRLQTLSMTILNANSTGTSNKYNWASFIFLDQIADKKGNLFTLNYGARRFAIKQVKFRRGMVEWVKCDGYETWRDIGPAIVKKYPITAVTISDTSPLITGGMSYWHLQEYPENVLPYTVPLWLWPRLVFTTLGETPALTVRPALHNILTFLATVAKSQEVALKHQSDTLVNWARRRAGLRSLRFPARIDSTQKINMPGPAGG